MSSDSHRPAARLDGRSNEQEESEPGREHDGGGETSKLRLARRAFLASAGATGALAPWLLGGEPVLAEWLLLAGATATAVAGFWVRALCMRTYSGRSAWKVERAALVCGAVLLGWMLVQALNPAFRVEIEGNNARLVALKPITWLPLSIADAFDGGGGKLPVFRNAWRYLLIFGTSWLYVAGLAAGFRERDNARKWARIMGVNAAGLAVISILHAATRSHQTLWFFAGTEESGGGAVFLSRSQEGAYLAASVALVCGLATSEKESKPGRRKWEATALLLWVATALAGSLIATACATVTLVIYWKIKREERRGAWIEPNIWQAWIFGGVATVVAIVAIMSAGSLEMSDRDESSSHIVPSWWERAGGGSMRTTMREVGLAMWVDHPITGWGGGAYPNLFEIYGEKVVSMSAHLHALPPGASRPQGVNAQCDVVELLVDYGVCGLLLLLTIFGVHLHSWIYWRGWKDPLALFLMVGSLGVVLHSCGDSVVRNPGLLLLFSGLPIAAVRLAAPSKGKKPGRKSSLPLYINTDRAPPGRK